MDSAENYPRVWLDEEGLIHGACGSSRLIGDNPEGHPVISFENFYGWTMTTSFYNEDR